MTTIEHFAKEYRLRVTRDSCNDPIICRPPIQRGMRAHYRGGPGAISRRLIAGYPGRAGSESAGTTTEAGSVKTMVQPTEMILEAPGEAGQGCVGLDRHVGFAVFAMSGMRRSICRSVPELFTVGNQGITWTAVRTGEAPLGHDSIGTESGGKF